jgi:hypothetical protein
MPRYLVESYSAGSATSVAEAQARARRAAELGTGVRYLRTTFLPDDETLFHVFEAPSAAALVQAGRRAKLPFERIVKAIEDPTASHDQQTREGLA